MTGSTTDIADAICLKRNKLEALEWEQRNKDTSTEIFQGLSTGTTQEEVDTSALTASKTSDKDSGIVAAGTAVLPGNADCTTTTTPIELTATTTKTLLKDERYNNLDAVVDREGRLKYTTQLFEKLPEVYHKELTTLILTNVKFGEYVKNKTTGITNLKIKEFMPSRINIVDKIKLDHLKEIQSSGGTCLNLQNGKTVLNNTNKI